MGVVTPQSTLNKLKTAHPLSAAELAHFFCGMSQTARLQRLLRPPEQPKDPDKEVAHDR